MDREPVNDDIEKANKRLKSNNQVMKDDEEIIFTGSNEEDVERLLSGCKELVFLLVFREGFLQFRVITSLGFCFGSPLGVVVRVKGQEGEVIFIRAELWRQSCPSQFSSGTLSSFTQEAGVRCQGILEQSGGCLAPSTSLSLSLRLLDVTVRSSCLLLSWLC